MLTIRELTSDEEIDNAFPLMAQLRPHLRRETFVEVVRRQQRDGYRLIGALAGGTLVALAGVRDAHTLMRGPHLFVDDLVTLESHRRQGHARALLRWLAADASTRNLPRLYLDSRDTAWPFYERVGFTPTTGIPCWIEVAEMLR